MPLGGLCLAGCCDCQNCPPSSRASVTISGWGGDWSVADGTYVINGVGACLLHGLFTLSALCTSEGGDACPTATLNSQVGITLALYYDPTTNKTNYVLDVGACHAVQAGPDSVEVAPGCCECSNCAAQATLARSGPPDCHPSVPSLSFSGFAPTLEPCGAALAGLTATVTFL